MNSGSKSANHPRISCRPAGSLAIARRDACSFSCGRRCEEPSGGSLAIPARHHDLANVRVGRLGRVAWRDRFFGRAGQSRRRRTLRYERSRRAAVNPGCDKRDLERREGRIVREIPVPADGVPHRHAARQDLMLDRARPRPRLGVGGQRHRRAAAVAVTRHAPRADDGRDFAVPRDGGRNALVGAQTCEPKRPPTMPQPRQAQSQRTRLVNHEAVK